MKTDLTNVTVSDELRAMIPDNVDLVYWDYYNSDVRPEKAAMFEHMIQEHKRFHNPIAFAGGIGENAVGVRAHILEGLEEFGIKIDPELNKIRGSQHRYISTEDSRVKVAVIPTDEELEICRISVELVNAQ